MAQQSFAHGIDDRCRVVEIQDPQPERFLRVPVDAVDAFVQAGVAVPRRDDDGDDRIHLEAPGLRSEEHTSELQSLMRISYAVFCLKKKKNVKREKQRKSTQEIIL